MKPAELHVLHQSDFYRITDYRCNCVECHTSAEEYTRSFNLCFVRSGYFEYRVFRRNLEVHVGRVLISKPGFTHYTHHIANQPDICSVFYLADSFVKSTEDSFPAATWFFNNREVQSLLLHCTPEIDYLHHRIINQKVHGQTDRLQTDEWVLRLLETIMHTLTNQAPTPVAPGLKRYHLATVERAKEYMLTHFNENISLQTLADHCCVSIFHFARIFKSIMQVTPYQYLSHIRLSHAHVLLGSTDAGIAAVAFQCGYASAEHFATAYRQHFGVVPSLHRRQIN